MPRPWLLVLALLAAPLPVAGDDRTLPAYEPLPGLAGSLSSTGSDTLANLFTLWAQAFRNRHPAVTVQVQAAGSATAPPALAEGTADIGPMSRPMKETELDAFARRYGYPPTAVPVAIDALALFVHRDNPLGAVSVRELDAIFSATRRCGSPRQLTHWGDLGLRRAWRRRPVLAYGRNSASGTYAYFRSRVLCDGDFRADVHELPGSASVVQAVGASPGAIGYSSIGYASAGVRALAVAGADGVAVLPSLDAAAAGEYPLSRFLYAYVNRPPGAALPLPLREFLRFILSREGQRLVLRDGYVPLSAPLVAEQRRALGLQ